MDYIIHEVDGQANADTINAFNRLSPDIFPELKQRHFTDGLWWLAHCRVGPDYWDAEPIAFAGMVPFTPFAGYGYLKRCHVLPSHHGHGLQYRLMVLREVKARQLGWTHLVSECLESNQFSSANFRKAGFVLTDPEQRWGAPGSIYWMKVL